MDFKGAQSSSLNEIVNFRDIDLQDIIHAVFL